MVTIPLIEKWRHLLTGAVKKFQLLVRSKNSPRRLREISDRSKNEENARRNLSYSVQKILRARSSDFSILQFESWVFQRTERIKMASRDTATIYRCYMCDLPNENYDYVAQHFIENHQSEKFNSEELSSLPMLLYKIITRYFYLCSN